MLELEGVLIDALPVCGVLARPLDSPSRTVAAPATSRSARLARDGFRGSFPELMLDALLELRTEPASGGLNKSSASVGRRSIPGAVLTTVACGVFAGTLLTFILVARLFRLVVPVPHRYSFHPLVVPLVVFVPSVDGSDKLLARMVASLT